MQTQTLRMIIDPTELPLPENLGRMWM